MSAKRRQTLSALDPNSRHSSGGSVGGAMRQSLGAPASRASIPKKRSTSLSRRSSVMGKGSSSKNSDPRALNSKSYQLEEIQMLVTFLMENDYQERISEKILKQPTARDFHQIVSFLFKLIDSNYVPGKIEDDVPAVFKALGYPFGISKTSLTAVGSPHTWPSLLGCLSWMVILLEYDRAVQQAEEERNANGDDDQAFFFNYLRDSYQAFLSGDDDAYDALDQQIASTFEEKYEAMENEMNELESHNENLRKQIEDLKSAESSLPALKSKKQDYESDLEKLNQAVQQREKNKKDMENYRDAQHSKYNQKVEKKNHLLQRISEIKEIISTQEISPAGLESLRNKKQELSKEKAKIEGEHEDVQKNLQESESQVTENDRKLAERLEQYLDYIKDVADSDTEYKYNSKLFFNQDEILEEDLEKKLIPALKSLYNTKKKEAASTSMKIIEEKNNLDEKKEELQSQQQEIQDIEKKSSQLQRDYKKEKETFDEHQRSHTSNMDTMESQISEARERKLHNEELAREYDDMYIETKADEAESKKAELKEEEEMMQKKLDDAFQKLIAHRQKVDSSLEDLVHKYSEEAQKVKGNDQRNSSVFQPSQQTARPPPAQESDSSFKFDLDASGEIDDEGLLYVDEAQ